jgi:hypothetical protein
MAGRLRQEALSVMAPLGHQTFHLILGLDAFRDYRNAETASQIDHGSDDCPLACVASQIANQAALDLGDIDRELLQMRWGGVTCAEVIQRRLYAGRAQQCHGPVHVFKAARETSGCGSVPVVRATVQKNCRDGIRLPRQETLRKNEKHRSSACLIAAAQGGSRPPCLTAQTYDEASA